MKVLTESDVWNKLTAYCSAAEHARADVEEKMRNWQLAEDTIQRIADRLEQESYVNADRYARSFVHDKWTFNGWGKQKIAWALRAKHIDEGVIERSLKEIDPDDYMEKLRGVLDAKRRSLRTEDTYEQRNKLIRFAAGRGYNMEEILKCIS